MPLVGCGLWMEHVAGAIGRLRSVEGAIGRLRSIDGACGRCHW